MNIRNLISKLYHMITLDFLFPRTYAHHTKRPLIQNKVVFIELNLPKLSNSLRLLHNHLQQNDNYLIHTHCLREAYSSKPAYICKALACLKDLADTKYIFICEGSRLISSISPRPETHITQVWHGCGAFKKFGHSIGPIDYPYYDNCNLVTVSSPEVVEIYETAMNLPKSSNVVKPLGISRTDIFYNKAFKEQAQKRVSAHLAKTLPGYTGKRRLLLWAPTFRGNAGNAIAPEMPNLAVMRSALAGRYLLLIKHHPLVKARPEIPAASANFAIDISDHCSIEDLIIVSDMCISDYSSLVFEYSLMERPMLFFAPDINEYDHSRGFYYNYEEMTPGPITTTTEELITQINAMDANFDKTEVVAFRNKFMSACDGQATRRILGDMGLS